ncbi:acyltransferase family protein [Microbacterium invictum]|uniref:Acyltransferase family protein n=1 Tax=Microbacterium invictum TaxID=515415 RepID=A0ABZ0V864_9MICO|nr:acyltransferase family protein [Microbacterium invictum]WQB69823.1 acyltransferase family protein [Microbacterium invictum]
MRLAWPDVARGAAMILVVLAHAIQLMGAYGWENGWLDTVNLYLTAVRMPLFFLISGIFAARAIRRSWRALFASRLALLIYMYLLWMIVRAVWFTFVPWPLNEEHPWLALAVAPIWPTNGLWFLYALIVYIVLAKLTAALRAWIPLAGGCAISLAAAYDVIPTGGNSVWTSIALYLFFFLLGARLPKVWSTLADRSNPAVAALALVVVPGCILVFSVLPDALEGVGRVVLSVVCVAAALAVASLVSRWRWIATPLRYVGERTIAIYVTHAMLLAALVPLVPPDVVPPAAAAVGFTAVGVLIPLLIRRAVGDRSGVFTLPRGLQRRLEASVTVAKTARRFR